MKVSERLDQLRNLTGDPRFEEFRAIMTAERAFERLADHAGQFIGRMNNEDREVVLLEALISAWEFSDEFDPVCESLLRYWDMALRESIKQRDYWMVRDLNGWRRIRSDVLNLGVFIIGKGFV